MSATAIHRQVQDRDEWLTAGPLDGRLDWLWGPYALAVVYPAKEQAVLALVGYQREAHERLSLERVDLLRARLRGIDHAVAAGRARTLCERDITESPLHPFAPASLSQKACTSCRRIAASVAA